MQTHSATWVKKVLDQGDGEALEFLITKAKINIHLITIDGISPVEYCFNHDSETIPLARCLSVLMAHDASFMIPILDGLSMAHYILKKPDHPLAQAFFDQKAKTISRRNFWKKLSLEIKSYLTEHASANQKDELVTLQKDFEIYSENPSLFIRPPIKTLYQLVEEWVRPEKDIGPAVLKILSEDRIYDMKCQTYDRLAQEYADQLVEHLPGKTKEFLQSLQELPRIIFPKDRKLCVQELKEVVITKINMEIEKLESRLKILQISCGYPELREIDKIILYGSHSDDEERSQKKEEPCLKEVSQALNCLAENQKEKTIPVQKLEREMSTFEIFSKTQAERKPKKSLTQSNNQPDTKKPLTVEALNKSFEAFFEKRVSMGSKPYDRPKKTLPPISEKTENEELASISKQTIPNKFYLNINKTANRK